MTAGGLDYPLGGSCPDVRPTVEWTYQPPCRNALDGATLRDLCAQGAGLCNVPASVLAGLDARKFYFLTAFRARLLTAVQTNGSGKGELSSLVKDGADETGLAATDGPINRTLQPFWAPGDSSVRIDPVAAEKTVVAYNMSPRGDWDNIHFKEEINTGVFFQGCNNPRFTGVDQNPCMHLHENWLNRTPGVNTTYSKGQKVLWYDLVFRAGAGESPNHASSIDNGEALGTPLGKDLVLWVESIAASSDCAPAAGARPGGLDNTTRPCIVFPRGIFFTPRWQPPRPARARSRRPAAAGTELWPRLTAATAPTS